MMFRKFLNNWTKASPCEKFEGAHEQLNDSSENLLATPRQPTDCPDLSIIGHAFDEAIAFLRSEQHENLNKAAAEWIQTQTVQILRQLRNELARLEGCKSDPLSLPAYAICPKQRLALHISPVPVLVAEYARDCAKYFQDFLRACGFTAKVRSYYSGTPLQYINADVSFPKVRKRKKFRKQALELSAVKANADELVKECIVVHKQLNAIIEIESDD